MTTSRPYDPFSPSGAGEPPEPEGLFFTPEVNGSEVTIPQPTGPGSEPGVPIEINWGDGSAVEYAETTPGSATPFPVVHTYAATGDYTVTLDPAGDEYPPATQDVTVSAPAGEGEDLNALTKVELKARLDAAGVEYSATATKAELIELLEACS